VGRGHGDRDHHDTQHGVGDGFLDEVPYERRWGIRVADLPVPLGAERALGHCPVQNRQGVDGL
jgi:hypothetical protein